MCSIIVIKNRGILLLLLLFAVLSVVRETNAIDIITTIAGEGYFGCFGDEGVAINAQLSLPQGVTVDSSGDIYIADSGCNKLRKVSCNTV